MSRRTNLLLSAGFAGLVLGTLFGVKQERIYRPGDYVKDEDAYFVEKVEDPTGLIKAHKLITPTDPYYSTQKDYSHGSNMIGEAESVWSSFTGKGTTVAIIDDGFDYNHPEYIRSDGTHAILSTSRYYYESNGYAYNQKYSTDPSCIAEDWESTEWATHGTNTSTTAAAPINGEGGVGIAPDADILALKIDMSFVAIKDAIQYAIDQQVDVINMSLGAFAESFTDGFGDKQNGSSGTATYLNDVCKAAYDAGIIVVASAGNEATWHKSYPACNTKVIGVGALEENMPTTLGAFTNYVGESQTGEVNVDILAPGYVYTATQGGTQNSISHTYSTTQGTSFSSPIVAGAACLWKEKNPNGTPDQFLEQLQSTASDIGIYKNKYVPVSWYEGVDQNAGPSNIEAGRLNLGGLLDITSPFVAADQSSINIATGESKQITISNSVGTVSYSSANSSIATVSDAGLVKGIAEGSTTITVTATKNGDTANVEIPVTVNASVAATSIEFSKDSLTLSVGDSYDVESLLSVNPENASRIFLFESTDETVATVNEDTGLVNALKAGSTTINAIAGYGNGYDSIEITVVNASQTSGTVTFGNNGNFNVTGTSVSGKDSALNTWNVSTAGTTSFTQQDDYSQIGSASNAASSIDFSMTLNSEVTFKSVSASFGGFSGSSATVAIKVGSTTIGTGSVPSSADQTISSTSTAVGTTLTVSLTNISKGIKAYSISYTYSGEVAPSPTVNSVTVTPSALSLDVYSDPTGNLSATVAGTNDPAQTVTWTSSNTSIATVSDAGVVTAKAKGNATITATSTIDNTKSGTCSVTVEDSTPVTLSSISVSNYKTSFFIGDAFTFGGTVTATFTDASSQDVTASATFEGYNMSVAGNYTITVSYTYGGVTKTTTYQISVVAEASGTVIYAASNASSASLENGTAPNGSSITYKNNGSNNYDQMTSGKKETWTISGYSGYTITKIRANLHKNSSSGGGSAALTNNGENVVLTTSSFPRASLTSSYQYYELLATEDAFECAGTLVLTLASSENSFWCNKIEVSYEKIDKSNKIVDSLSATYNGSSIFVGSELDTSKVSVTAHYTDSEKYPDAALLSSDYELSGFNSSSAGEKTVTVIYTGKYNTSVSPLTTTFNVEVITDDVVSVVPTVSKAFHPGETISKSDITVSLTRLSSASETTQNFEFSEEGYQFTYSDTAAGRHFTITYEGQDYGFEVTVSRVAYVEQEDSTLTITGSKAADAGITTGGARDIADYDSVNIDGITCSLTQAYVYNQNGKFISFGKNAGEIHNVVALSQSITSISLTVMAGSRTDGVIYISTDGTNWVVYSDSVASAGDYRYFKIAYEGSSDSYSNIQTITINTASTDSAANVANYIMYEDTENQCLTKLHIAIKKLNTMSSSDKDSFWNSSDYVIATARERLLAWATSQGVTLTYSGDVYDLNSAKGIEVFGESTSQSDVIVVSSAAAFVSVLALGGYFILKRKKENRI